MTDIDNYNADQDMVVLMTIHAAKGLEFHTVFLVGLEEGIFPGNQSIYATEKDMEEERRLMYVGITRAKRKLYLTNAYQRLLFGMTNRNRPSRFVGEIPEDCVEITSSRPAFGGFGGQSAGTKSFGSSYGGSGFAGGSRSFGTSAVTPAYAPAKKPTTGFGASFAAKTSGGSVVPFKKGDRVKHKTFGGGLIVDAVPTGGDVLLTIAFDSIGNKKLMQKFAKLEKE
jgi:DNA helicase-2/ATP-dependent DNA helicase PcrA